MKEVWLFRLVWDKHPSRGRVIEVRILVLRCCRRRINWMVQSRFEAIGKRRSGFESVEGEIMRVRKACKR